MRLKTAFVSMVAAVAFGATAANAADITMRLHTLVKSPHPYNDMADYIKNELETKSGGKIEVKIFPAGTLGTDPTVLGEMKLGTIDLIVGSTSNAVKQVPEFQVFDIPYLFKDAETLQAAVGPGKPILGYYEKVFADRDLGIKLLAMGASGYRHMSNAKGPVNKLADVEGLKMRTPPSPLMSKTWEALGTQPVSIAWTELYAAVQTGVAQALESSIAGYKGSKLYEVAPYLALTGHVIQGNYVAVSNRAWGKLDDAQKAVLVAAANGSEVHGMAKTLGYEESLIKTLQSDNGVTVTKPDVAEFFNALVPIQDQMAQDLNITDAFAVVKANR